MGIFKKIFLQILYLTPIGPIFSLTKVIQDNENEYFGIKLVFPTKGSDSLMVQRPQNPSYRQRFSWFISGISIMIQAIWAFQHEINNNGKLFSFGLIAGIIGLVQVFCALFPNLDLNRKI